MTILTKSNIQESVKPLPLMIGNFAALIIELEERGITSLEEFKKYNDEGERGSEIVKYGTKYYWVHEC